MFRNTIAAPVEKMRPAVSFNLTKERKHQVWSEYSAHLSMALQSPHPHGGRAVWHNQQRISEYAEQIGLSLRFHHPVDPGYTDIPLAAFSHCSTEHWNRCGHTDRVDSDAKNISARHGHAIS